MKELEENLNDKFSQFLTKQANLEKEFCMFNQKENGVFLTSDSSVIDSVLKLVPNNESILEKSFLEPSCGQGIFLIKLIIKAFLVSSSKEDITKFIQDKLYFVDIDPEMIKITKNNISNLYFHLFNQEYKGTYNCFTADFTIMDDEFTDNEYRLSRLYKTIDFVVGNPPYITLYGRRDKKKNEAQRIYFLKNYSQFPSSLKNGKINYVMLFIERGLKFLKNKGQLSFIIDVAFFETAYIHCRKYLVENYTIESLTYNVKGFANVASGQVILVISNSVPKQNTVVVINSETKEESHVAQSSWDKPNDEYKFRISHCNKSDIILDKIFSKNNPTLKELYPKKNLRTCVMLLNMEERFTSVEKSKSVPSYPYYRGSNGLKYKYSKLNNLKYFNYDRVLQDNINDKLKEELLLKGIKNKKRIGLGETIIYDNPKVYIRQSAKELIASYEERPSSANNSLYVFSLRDNSPDTIIFLKYICGLINSTLYTFFAQQRRIIRYNKGKQPQIKTSDLYQIFIPECEELKLKISALVDHIYEDSCCTESYKADIDRLIYKYYCISEDEIDTIKKSIDAFLV
jgi:hypothetical protein